MDKVQEEDARALRDIWAPDAWTFKLVRLGSLGVSGVYSCSNSFRRIQTARRTNASLAGTSSDSKKLSITSFFHPISSCYNIVIPAIPVKTLPAFFYFGGNQPFLRGGNPGRARCDPAHHQKPRKTVNNTWGSLGV